MDLDYLHTHYKCECCCSDHTFSGCKARLWGGCRGQGTLSNDEISEWARHYGMTREQFLNWE